MLLLDALTVRPRLIPVALVPTAIAGASSLVFPGEVALFPHQRGGGRHWWFRMPQVGCVAVAVAVTIAVRLL